MSGSDELHSVAAESCNLKNIALTKQVEKIDSKVNALILFLATAATSLMMFVAKELFKFVTK
jgi:hypothetical protein